MTKSSAFGTVLKMGTGSVQIETQTVVGTISTAGDAGVTITAANLAGSPLMLLVPVALSDTASIVAGKIRAFLTATTAVAALFDVSGTGADVVLTRKIPMKNDATLNIGIADETCVGLTAAGTSTNTHAGETLGAVAYISNLGGPALSLDTEDVTTHDSPAAFEEVVATILRTGEASLDIVYDPAEATHDATSGLVYMLENKLLAGYSVTFPNTTVWSFAAFVTGFEPSAQHDGALTASVKMKITGAPILA